MKVEYREGRELNSNVMLSSPHSKAAISYREADLHSLEITYNSGRISGLTWRLVVLV